MLVKFICLKCRYISVSYVVFIIREKLPPFCTRCSVGNFNFLTLRPPLPPISLLLTPPFGVIKAAGWSFYYFHVFEILSERG